MEKTRRRKRASPQSQPDRASQPSTSDIPAKPADSVAVDGAPAVGPALPRLKLVDWRRVLVQLRAMRDTVDKSERPTDSEPPGGVGGASDTTTQARLRESGSAAQEAPAGTPPTASGQMVK